MFFFHIFFSAAHFFRGGRDNTLLSVFAFINLRRVLGTFSSRDTQRFKRRVVHVNGGPLENVKSAARSSSKLRKSGTKERE